jgi:predicted permease
MFELMRRVARRFRMLIGRAEREHGMDEEMRFHIDMEAAALQRSGFSAAAARRRARQQFGGVERFKEEGRDARGIRPVEDLWQDVRHAARQLRASAGFAVATVLTLALGIGAVTLLLGFMRPATLEPAGIFAPERLVYLGQGPRDCARCAGMAPGNHATIRGRARSFAGLSMFAEWEPTLRGVDRAELLDGLEVTPEIFQTLGIRPLLGRLFVPEDATVGRNRVVVVGEAAWRDRLGGDSAVIGRTMILDRQPYTVVGVVGKGVIFPNAGDRTEVWTPITWTPEMAADRVRARYGVIARLGEGVTPARASAEVAGIAARLSAVFPEQMSGTTFGVIPLLEINRQSGDAVNWIFTAAVGLVLLTACVNLAGLLLARLSARRRELALRRTLGATPGRVARQLLAEMTLLAVLSGVCAVFVAVWGGRLLLGPGRVGFNAPAFVSALAIGLACAWAIGLWPLLRFRPELIHELGAATRTATSGIDSARARRGLVVAEMALAIVLLSAAGLLARSFLNIYNVDPGFMTDGLLTVRIQIPPRSPDTPAEPEAVDRLVAALESITGVERAGSALGIPFGVGAASAAFEIAGHPRVESETHPRARMQAVTPGYFRALGIPILRGRPFDDADRAGAAPVALINEALAARHFPGEDPFGHAVIIGGVRWQIVGIVGTVFNGDVEQLAVPEIYRPMRQWQQSSAWLVARTRGDATRLGPSVRAAVHAADPDIAITRMLTMDALRAGDMEAESRILRLMAGFALGALLISTIGLYGLISYSVAQRTREFGVRLALGARAASVRRLVLAEGVRMAAIGALLGIAAAFGALRVLQSLLFRISPTDPVTLGAVALLVCAVAALASYLPARRATLVDPLTSLREE